MFSIELDKETQQEFEKMMKSVPVTADKILKNSLRKVINYVKNVEKQHMQNKYTPEKEILGAKGLKTKVKNGEAELNTSTKRNKMTSFEISSKFPMASKPGRYINVAIKRGKGTDTNIFWGFYKSTGKRFGLGLYKRTSSSSRNITPVRTVSVFQMSFIPTEKEELEMKSIFIQELVSQMRCIDYEK